MNNITTRLPKRGDIVARKLNSTSGYVYSDKDNVFFVMENFVESEVSSTHEILGVVAQRFHDEVLVVFKKNYGNLKWCRRCWNIMTDIPLTGSENRIYLNLRFSGNWNTDVEKIISYKASTIEEFVAALNGTAAQGYTDGLFYTDADFKGQDWWAVKIDENTVRLEYNCLNAAQINNKTQSRETTVTMLSLMSDIPMLSNMSRKNGGTGTVGASAMFARYVNYYDSQAAVTLGEQAPIKTTGAPMAKATYIAEANQQYLTNCIAKYGSGEAGWLKYMKSCKPIRETDYGVHGIHDGKVRGADYGTRRYTSSTVSTSTPMMPASEKCYNIPTYESLTTVYAGDFWLPTTQEMDYIMQDVLYGTAGTYGTEDDINSGLNKITGHVHISNGTYYWCGVRCHASLAWLTNGTRGYFGNDLFYCAYSALPVSHFKIV